MMNFLASLLFGASVFFALLWRVSDKNRSRLALRVAGLGEEPLRRKNNGKIYHNMIWRTIDALGQLAPWRGHSGVETLLQESGSSWTTHRFLGVRRACGLACCLPLLTLGLPAAPFLPLAYAAGTRIPPLFLDRRRRRILEGLGSELPEVMDLIAVLCFAGESLQRSLRCSLSVPHNPWVRRELEGVMEGLHLGEGLGEALRRLSVHPCRELRRFARTLTRAEESGAPVSEILSQMATEMRHARREKNRVRAARASVMVLFPLVFMILPSFLLLTVGSMILGHGP
ncbi:MAG: type II secretion system F family protein [Actinomycetota bacterium]